MSTEELDWLLDDALAKGERSMPVDKVEIKLSSDTSPADHNPSRIELAMAAHKQIPDQLSSDHVHGIITDLVDAPNSADHRLTTSSGGHKLKLPQAQTAPR
jgi:hypothetical protein